MGYRAGGWCVQLKRFNGVPIRNLKQLVKLVEDSCSYYQITQEDMASTPQQRPDSKDSSSSSTSAPSMEQVPSPAESSRRRKSDFLRFDVGERGTTLVLDTDEVCLAEKSILQTHSISSPKSEDLC